MGRRPLPKHITALVCKTLTSQTTCGISNPFGLLFHTSGQVTYVLLTRPPLRYPRRGLFVRLACVRHAASVHPEPGSNSPSSKEQSEDCKGLTFEPEHRILPITFQLLKCCLPLTRAGRVYHAAYKLSRGKFHILFPLAKKKRCRPSGASARDAKTSCLKGVTTTPSGVVRVSPPALQLLGLSGSAGRNRITSHV